MKKHNPNEPLSPAEENALKAAELAFLAQPPETRWRQIELLHRFQSGCGEDRALVLLLLDPKLAENPELLAERTGVTPRALRRYKRVRTASALLRGERHGPQYRGSKTEGGLEAFEDDGEAA